jgi:hypothetical protein
MVNLGSTCSWQALTFLLTIEGHKMTMLEIQREYKQEYEGLGDAKREELLHEFKENSDTVKATLVATIVYKIHKANASTPISLKPIKSKI